MQFFQLLQRDFIDLQMAMITTTFRVHHPDEVAKPVGLLVLLFVSIVKMVYILSADTTQRATEGTNGVFYLPHIQQVFGNIAFS
jgi:hypothetical protein